MPTGGLVWLSVRGLRWPAGGRVGGSTEITADWLLLAVCRSTDGGRTRLAVLVVHAGTKEVLFSIKNEMILMYLIWHQTEKRFDFIKLNVRPLD